MKKLLFPLLLVLITSLSACKKDGGEPITPPEPIGTKDIQIQLPASSTIDLSKTFAVGLSVPVSVTADGKAKLPFNNGTKELAYLTDKDDNILLMGFITEDSTTMSVSTTAKVLLYYGLGSWFLPKNSKEAIIKDAGSLPGFGDYVKKLEQKFVTDPLVFHKGGFSDVLNPLVEQLTKHDTINLFSRQILVEDPTIRSGLQVAEYDFKNIEISNYYRRRAHAFVYKTAWKDKNGIETIIKSTIGESDVATKDAKVSPTSAIREVIGTSLDVMMGKGMDFAVTKTDPVELPLGDAESEATYKVRIIGPGMPGVPLTKAEDEKQMELLYEFFTMDMLLPLIMDFVGHKDLAHDITGDARLDLKSEPFDLLIKLTSSAIAAVPSASSALKEGNYPEALSEFLAAFRGNLAGQSKDIIEAVIKVGVWYAKNKYVNAQYFIDRQASAEKGLKKVGALLGIADVILKFNDYRRLVKHIVSSSALEQWTVKAKEEKIRLEPKNASVVTQTDQNLQVYPKTTISQGAVLEYEWFTSGRYGKLKDNLGHNDVSFTSSSDKVTYRSTASSATIGDGKEETVIVTAYIKEPGGRTKLGSDTSIIKIKPVKHKIVPDGITLTGRSNGTRSVALKIKRADGENDIVSNDVLDFKVEWNTAGKFGKFYGSENQATTHGNTVNYECLDDQTKEGVENITAKIYVRKKGDVEWTFFEDVKGTVNILNDPKKITLIVPVTYTSKILTPSVGNWAVFPTVKWAVDPEADSYKVTLYNFSGTQNSPPEGATYSWRAGTRPPTPYNIFPETFDIDGGMQYMVFGRTWCGGRCDESSTGTWIANYRSLWGDPSAEVIITLK